MLENLTDIFTSENKSVSKEINWEPEAIEVAGVQYDILEKSPMKIDLKNIGKGQVLVKITGSLTLKLGCDRCLKDVIYPFTLDIEEEVVSPEREEMMDPDDVNYMDGYNLKVDDLICSDIALNWPMKILCREDCKGICRICGKDLNTGTCGCDTFVPSPGLAGIKEIINENKEV